MAEVQLPGLQPDQWYHAQVRGVNAEGASAWSAEFVFKTDKDTVAPEAVTGLTVTAQGTSFVATWNASTASDLKDYKVILADGTPNQRIHYVTTNRFEVTLEMNKAMYAGSPSPTIPFSVAARDNSDNLSAATTATGTNPPPAAPTGVAVQPVLGGFAVTWKANTEPDIAKYRIHMGTTASFVKSATTVYWEGDATAFTVETLNLADHWIEVEAVDAVNAAAGTRVGPFKIIDPFYVDLTPPAAVVNFRSTATGMSDTAGAVGFIDLAWNANTDTDLLGYKIRYGLSAASGWQFMDVGPDETTARLTGLIPGKPYYISIQAYDVDANYNASVSVTGNPITVAADTTRPAAPTGVTAAGGATTITVTWTENTEADVKGGLGRYRVEYDTVSTFATSKSVLVSGTVTSLSGLTPSTNYYIRVFARDLSENESLTGTNATPFPVPLGNAGSNVSDGAVPTATVVPQVTPLYQALEVRWSPATNPDPLTYEVHLSTTNNFTVSDATKVGEVDGTFFIIKSLPGSTTPLTYGTTYYVKIRLKDRDGTATAVGAQGSAIPLRVDNGDIAANAVRANQIMAGQITADKLTIGNMTNIVDNGSYDFDGLGWLGITANITFPTAPADTYRSGKSIRIAANSTINDVYNANYIPVAPGETYYYEQWVRADAGTNGTAYGGGFFAYTSTKALAASAYPTTSISAATAVGGWSKVTGQYTVAADVAFLRPWLSVRADSTTGAWYFDEFIVRRQVGTTEIQAGSITTGMINTAGLAADHIKTGTMDGDRIAANTLMADRLEANSAFTQNLTVSSTFTIGSATGAAGQIRSFNYDGAGNGFKLDSSGLDIRSGTIMAKALQIQEANNIILPEYADFEYAIASYSGKFGGSASTFTVVNTDARMGTQSLRWTGTGTAQKYVYFGPNFDTYNVPVEAGEYIISAWVKNNIAGARSFSLMARASNGTYLSALVNVSIPASQTWTRYSGVLTVPAGVTALIPYLENNVSQDIDFSVDLVQIERKISGLATPSAWTRPGTTSIDGGAIRTGSVASSTGAWSINLTGAATFVEAYVSGNMQVSNSTSAYVQSANYAAGSTGWRIRGDGWAELNNVTIRGSLAGATGSFTGSLNVGSNKFNVDTSGNMFFNATSWQDAVNNGRFRVDSSGNMAGVQAAAIVGTLTASAVSTGGVNISSAGAITSANFNVTSSGVATLTSAAINGGTLKVFNNTNDSNVYIDSNGIYAGNASTGSAPFFVNTSGQLWATSATITGAIQSGSSITGATITGGSLSTNTSGTRVIMSSGQGNRIDFHTGDAYTDVHPSISSGINGSGSSASTQTFLFMSSGSQHWSGRNATVYLYGASESNNMETFATWYTDRIEDHVVRSEVWHHDFDVNYGTNVQGFRVGQDNNKNNHVRLVHSGAGGNSHIDNYGGNSRVYINWFNGNGGTHFGNGGQNYGTIHYNATGSGSSIKIKKNVRKIPHGKNSLMKLTPKAYELKVHEPDRERYGFIAEELIEVMPNLVTKIDNLDNPHYKDAPELFINYEDIIPILVNAVQEQDAEISELRATVADLASRLPKKP